MDFSPSPLNAAFPQPRTNSNSATYRINRLSPSPPPPNQQQSLNKRDRKRQAMTDRLAEISNNFSKDRDWYYRERLRSFQGDIAYITNAPLYDNRPLDDFGDETAAATDDLETGTAGSTQGSVRSSLLPAKINGKVPVPAALGKHAAGFVQEVNSALEQKDASLVEVANKYNFVVESLYKDYVYSVSVADEEHKRLMEALRQRLISNVHAKKAALQRDKEKLDIADTNALLYHPNQFSINNGASPGGPSSNRKTRHTRHRMEVDEVDPSAAPNGKRRRKGLLEGEVGSPAREVEPVTATRGIDLRSDDPQNPPNYSMDKLFTEKELNTYLQAASLEVLAQQQASKRRKLDVLGENEGSQAGQNEDVDMTRDAGAAGDSNTSVAEQTLEAPNMERSNTSQSASHTANNYYYHATRSTRRDLTSFTASLNNLLLASSAANTTASNPLGISNPHGLVNGETTGRMIGLGNLGELAGRQAGAELLTTTFGGAKEREKKNKGNDAGDDYNRAPALSDQEALADFALMAKAMRAEDEVREHGAGGSTAAANGHAAKGGRKKDRRGNQVNSNGAAATGPDASVGVAGIDGNLTGGGIGGGIAEDASLAAALGIEASNGTGIGVAAAPPNLAAAGMIEFTAALLDEVAGEREDYVRMPVLSS